MSAVFSSSVIWLKSLSTRASPVTTGTALCPTTAAPATLRTAMAIRHTAARVVFMPARHASRHSLVPLQPVHGETMGDKPAKLLHFEAVGTRPNPHDIGSTFFDSFDRTAIFCEVCSRDCGQENLGRGVRRNGNPQ